MTENEAIKQAYGEIIGTNYGECQCHESTMRIAIKALEKQIAKRIIRTSFIDPIWLCPSCNAELEVIKLYSSYCPYCGQFIDWSDEE